MDMAEATTPILMEVVTEPLQTVTQAAEGTVEQAASVALPVTRCLTSEPT